MTKEEFLERIEKIPLKDIDKDFFLEYNATIYDLLDQLEQLKRMYNTDCLNKWEKLRKKLESGMLIKKKIPIDLGRDHTGAQLRTYILTDDNITEKDILKVMNEIEEEEKINERFSRK